MNQPPIDREYRSGFLIALSAGVQTDRLDPEEVCNFCWLLMVFIEKCRYEN